MAVVANIADRVGVMYLVQIVELGTQAWFCAILAAGIWWLNWV